MDNVETTEHVAPTVEKVSLSEIKQEQVNEDFEIVADILGEYLDLSEQDRQAVMSDLFED